MGGLLRRMSLVPTSGEDESLAWPGHRLGGVAAGAASQRSAFLVLLCWGGKFAADTVHWYSCFRCCFLLFGFGLF